MTLRRTRSNLQLSEPPVEEWWEGGSSAGSADEGPGTSEYDCGILDLGTETPPAGSPNLVENNAFVAQWAQAGIAVPRVPVRRTSLRALGKERERAFLTKESVDRDCGICFEYAVMPCRTLCCGKIFCTEHLADWLHGPNAASQGTCPNCENPCSLESSTTLLTSSVLRDAPSLTRRRAHTVCASSTQHIKPKAKPGVYALSPLTAVQPRRNDTLPGSLNEGTSHSHALGQSTNLSSSSSATTVSSLESDEEPKRGKHSHTPSLVSSTSPSTTSTTPFAASWGAVSRLLSIITFLMFIYKLLS